MVPVPVDRAAKPGTGEFADVIVEILSRQPRRKRIGVDKTIEQFHVDCLVGGPRSRRRIARNGKEEFAQEGTRIGLGFRLGNTLFLEIRLIKELAARSE